VTRDLEDISASQGKYNTTGQALTDVQREVRHPALRWMAATSTALSKRSARYLRPSSCRPWTLSEEVAGEKYIPQLQRNMWVVTTCVRRPADAPIICVLCYGQRQWDDTFSHQLVSSPERCTSR
jgi:hypothetical protein